MRWTKGWFRWGGSSCGLHLPARRAGRTARIRTRKFGTVPARQVMLSLEKNQLINGLNDFVNS